MRQTTTELVHDEITETLDEFRAWLQARGLAPATIHYYLADVEAYLRWLSEHPHGEMECHDRERVDPAGV
jgi:hypothetical protein